jgi:hypothetical protein
MNGEKLITKTIFNKKYEFLLTDLPYGVYTIKIITTDKPETFKLVKTR